MKCTRCSNKVEDKWDFCPKCGNILKPINFNEVFEKMRKEMERVDKVFEKEMGFVDLSPFFRQPEKKSSGFTIRITRAGGGEPKVSVQTFGDVDKRALKGMGVQPGPVQRLERPQAASTERQSESFIQPKSTEEPEASVKTIGDRVVVQIKMPDVKSESNIHLKELESSVEVKALVGDKAYFKILTKPENRRIIKKSFSKGILHIEFL